MLTYLNTKIHFKFVMGLLTKGEAFNWEDTHKNAEHVRKHGIRQFINQYNKLKNRQDGCLKWGDEVSINKEYNLTAQLNFFRWNI